MGLAIGIDSLPDPNRQSWVYQRQPWFGVLSGLNLNGGLLFSGKD